MGVEREEGGGLRQRHKITLLLSNNNRFRVFTTPNFRSSLTCSVI